MTRVVPVDDNTPPDLLSQTSMVGGTANMGTTEQRDEDVSERHRVCLTELAQRLGGDLPRPAWEASSSSNGIAVGNVSSTTKRDGIPRLCDRIKERAGNASVKRKSFVTYCCTPCLKLKHIQWPKLRSKLMQIASYEVWKGRIKQVEAYYGTAVAAYFVSLRWLLWVNVVLCVVWCGCVCIPQILWEASNAATASPDYNLQLLLACNYSNVSGFYDCSGYEWYSYILDLFTGQGTYRYTLLFLGHYSTSSKVLSDSYNIPAAILFFTLVTYVASFVLVTFRLGHVYNGSYLDLSADASSNFCNKLFSAWDFNVADPETVKLKKACIATDLKRIEISLTPLKNLDGNVPVVLKAFLVPIVMNTLELVLPRFFEFVVRLEKFKTRSGEVAMTMIRTAVVRIGNMGIYSVLLYTVISCTQQTGDMYLPTYSSNTLCVQCWETFLGQQFYTLALTNFLISLIGTIAIDTTRHILHKVFSPRVRKKILQRIFSRSTFSVSDNILDLISSQFLLWMGFLFFPLHPLLMIFMLVITFYLKWFNLMKNMEPKRRGIFRGALTQFMFVLLLLLVLIIAMIPVGFAVARLTPSEDCSPFKGKATMLSVITELIDTIANYRIQGLIKFLISSGFLIPLNMAYT
eukprot:Em0011g640a